MRIPVGRSEFVVFGVALALRAALIFLQSEADAPFDFTLLGEELEVSRAARLPNSEEPWRRAPGYLGLISITTEAPASEPARLPRYPFPTQIESSPYLSAQPELFGLRWFQALIDSLSALLLTLLARRAIQVGDSSQPSRLERAIPLIAGLFYALFGFAAFRSIQIGPESVGFFWLLLAMTLLLRPARWTFLAAGLALGAGLIIDKQLVWTVVPFGVALALAKPKTWLGLALFALGVSIIPGVCQFEVLRKSDTAMWLSSDTGIRAWQSSRMPELTGAIQPWEAEAQFHNLAPYSYAESSGQLLRAALSTPYESAGAWGKTLGFWVSKLAGSLSARLKSSLLGYRAEQAGWLTLFQIQLGAIFILGLAGLWSFGASPFLGLYRASVVGLLLGLTFGLATDSCRLSLAGLLCLSGARFVGAYWQQRSSRHWIAFGLAAVAVTVSTLTQGRDFDLEPVAEYYLVAGVKRQEQMITALQSGETTAIEDHREAAQQAFARSARLYDSSRESRVTQLGAILANYFFGQTEESIAELTALTQPTNPLDGEKYSIAGPELLTLLAKFKLDNLTAERMAEIEGDLFRALRLCPEYAPASGLLGEWREARSEWPLALSEYELARKRDPNRPLYALQEIRIRLIQYQFPVARRLLDKLKTRGLEFDAREQRLLAEVEQMLQEKSR